MQKVKLIFVVVFLICFISIEAQKDAYQTQIEIPYYPETIVRENAYIAERCILDVYYPKNEKAEATVVWFHGGGLTGGNKELPEQLKNKKLCVVGVNYRLSPKAKVTDCIADAAAAVAWTFNNINRFGGDNSLIFVSGHSAGGYLAAMVGLDKKWLAHYQIDANKLAGIIPFSGQTITHFTARKERGIADIQPIIDELAPLYHVRADASPLLLITGDRELEMLGRYEENAYLMRMMKVAGHQDTRLFEIQGYGHGMAEPAFPLLLNEIKRIVKIHKQ